MAEADKAAKPPPLNDSSPFMVGDLFLKTGVIYKSVSIDGGAAIAVPLTASRGFRHEPDAASKTFSLADAAVGLLRRLSMAPTAACARTVLFGYPGFSALGIAPFGLAIQTRGHNVLEIGDCVRLADGYGFEGESPIDAGRHFTFAGACKTTWKNGAYVAFVMQLELGQDQGHIILAAPPVALELVSRALDDDKVGIMHVARLVRLAR